MTLEVAEALVLVVETVVVVVIVIVAIVFPRGAISVWVITPFKTFQTFVTVN